MSNKRGVIGEYVSDSARPIVTKSILPIALVLKSKTKMPVGLHKFDSVASAYTYVTDLDIKDTDGNVAKYIKLAVLMNCTAPIVISIVKTVVDEAETKTRYLDAIELLKSAPSFTSYVPDIITVPDFGYDVDIINATNSVCEAFGARTFFDLNATTNDEARQRREAFGSDRLTVIKTGGTINDVPYDGGTLMAWARVRRDGEVGGMGIYKSISKVLLPISGVISPNNYRHGRGDDTDPLTEKQITSIIEYKGFRLWEYSTTSADPIWQDARRVRIMDSILDATVAALFYAIDEGLNELRTVKNSIRNYVSDLVGASVLLGADDVYLDTTLTTATAITKGEFYFRVNLQEMPSPKLIKITINRVDKFAPRLYELLAAA